MTKGIPIPITVDGIVYPTINAFCEHFRMSQRYVIRKIKSGLNGADLLSVKRRKRWLFDGQKYTTAEAVAHLGISRYQLRHWFSDTEHDLIGTKRRGK